MMARTTEADRAPIPADSLVFGYGPMLPFVAAAIGAWTMPSLWLAVATELAIVWGATILAFVAGVRRGYGFGNPQASTRVAIATMLVYFVPAGAALVLAGMGMVTFALLALMIGFALVAWLDPKAARAGDAPPHFAWLRRPQMAIAVLALGALLARLV